ncbi:MAG: DUF7948 domain-containing protein [Thermoanaerobaculia bacterium]
MGRARFFLALFASATIASTLVAASPQKSVFPLYFEPNVGQADARVQFVARGAGLPVFITAGEWFAAVGANTHNPRVIAMRLTGTGRDGRARGIDPLPGISNYFIDSDPAQWHTNVPHYAAVRVAEVYGGIDLVYRAGEAGALEYDFVVKPGADPRRINLRFEGIDDLEIVEGGDLVLHVGARELRQRAPVVYQEIGGVREMIRGGYSRRSGHDVVFEIDRFDRTKPLVIDPELALSSYLGGSDSDEGQGIALDRSGNEFVVGSTWSWNFPVTPGAVKTTNSAGNCDAFVAKFDEDGNVLYATYLGGSNGADEAHAVAVDADGTAYVAGETGSTSFPVTANAMQPVTGSQLDAFIVKLNPTGSALLYSTYAGGTGDDSAHAIAINAQHAMYVTGRTTSPAFRPGASRPGYHDAFVLELTSGGGFAHFAYLGGPDDDGSENDEGRGIAVDLNNNIYVVGMTESSLFPVTADALQHSLPPFGTSSGFVTKYDLNFNRVYSTYFGGTYDSELNAIAIDPYLYVYIAGKAARNIPYCTCASFEGSRGFVAKLLPPAAPVSSVAVGTPTGMQSDPAPQESATGVGLDDAGYVYVSGLTNSQVLATVNPLQSTLGGGFDAFVTKLRPDGTTIVFQTYLGGSSDEYYNESLPRIAVDEYGDAFIAGTTFSSNFPNPKNTIAGGSDAFIARIYLLSRGLDTPDIDATGFSNYVQLSWGSVVDATSYVIERASQRHEWYFRAVMTGPGSGPDTAVSPFTAYEYRIRPVADDATGQPSWGRLATVFDSTEQTPVGGMPIRSKQMTDLRRGIDAVRAFAGLGPYPYTHSVASGSAIKADDFNQARDALNEALAELTFDEYSHAHAPGTPIVASDFNALRDHTR